MGTGWPRNTLVPDHSVPGHQLVRFTRAVQRQQCNPAPTAVLHVHGGVLHGSPFASAGKRLETGISHAVRDIGKTRGSAQTSSPYGAVGTMMILSQLLWETLLEEFRWPRRAVE